MKKLRCLAGTHDHEMIPAAVVAALGATFSAVHGQAETMARAAVKMAALKNEPFYRLPFCGMVEAEAFGAEIQIPEAESGPKALGYPCKKIEDLLGPPPLDLTKGRIAEALRAVELLHEEQGSSPADTAGLIVLNVEGPFTVLSFLIDSGALLKALMTGRAVLEKVLPLIEDGLIRYIEAGVRCGADIISYADPAVALEIVGPKLYREIAGLSSFRLLKRVEHLPVLIHLCGRKSLALEEVGLCRAEEIALPVTGVKNYGEALRFFAASKEPLIIGHNCLKNAGMPVRQAMRIELEV
ncbi:MAG: hypothetical protein LBU39_02990 [Desulfobulbaceae bacterium]|jgi:uroporphyrinogen-III decarboxylase|nr:hypothetical protein [Desulfobulbaceae bacterium]